MDPESVEKWKKAVEQVRHDKSILFFFLQIMSHFRSSKFLRIRRYICLSLRQRRAERCRVYTYSANSKLSAVQDSIESSFILRIQRRHLI